MKIQSFTKKVTAVLTSLILVLSALLPAVWSLTVSAAEPERASGGSGAVCYLVPDNAGMSAVEVNDNGAMQLWNRSISRRQRWVVRKKGDYCYFCCAGTDEVIEVPGGNVSGSVQLKKARYDGSDKQLWKMDRAAGGSSYYIRSKINNNYVMDVSGATSNNGAAIKPHKINNGSNQRFSLVPIPETENYEFDYAGYGENECFAIVPLNAGGCCVDLSGSNGTTIQIWKTNRTDNQNWLVRKKGSYYYLQSRSTSKVIEVKGGKATPSAELQAAAYTGEDKQLWKLDPLSDGTYLIRSKLDETYTMDVKGETSSNGAKIQIFPEHRKCNERFRFVHTTTTEPMSEWGASRHDCYASDYDIWDGTAETGWYYADTSAYVYEISSAAELAGLSQLVRDDVCNFTGKTVLLKRDINLAGIEWRRIGSSYLPFRGSFDGGGHAITGLVITTTDDADGFFGQVSGGSISNFAIKGSVSGDWNTGGVVGNMERGHLINVYSEVSLTRATDDNEGGICGRLGYEAYIEHCTQNARVNSGDKDPDRGGICGYLCGVARYCVNESTVECDWDRVGGIAGCCAGGKIEYCANYGKVSGGSDTQWAGGIAGKSTGDAVIFGCYNAGSIYSADDDDIGGILGERCDSSTIFCCINNGSVHGDDRIGGIVGYGACSHCLNVGQVTGDDDVGAVTGKSGNIHWCRALSWTSARIRGSGDNNGGEWVTAEEVINGKACYDLNRREETPDLGGYGAKWKEVFFQNVGGDALPSFTGQKVSLNNGKYKNGEYEVRVEYQKGYGTVTGGGKYRSGSVTLKAEPADGCDFDHYEVKRTKIISKSMHKGDHEYPSDETVTYKDPELTLTKDIDSSYTVKAVFKVYDNVPEDLRQRIKIELECTNEVGGWNSSTVPVYLVDSAGEKHLWEAPRSNMDDDGDKISHTFDIGAASPISLEAWPDFGGGVTFRDYELKARMWVNDAGKAIESSRVKIRSWPFISSRYGSDYMNITFGNTGNSSVGVYGADGTLDVKGTYDKCSAALDAAKKLGKGAVIRLDSAWITTSRLVIGSGDEITLDLNGFPIIRSMKKTTDDGEVIDVRSGAVLNIVDSMPSRKTCSTFSGGSIQGGRSDNGGGILDVKGTVNMTGGAVYNGGTTDVGGGIRCKGGNVNLKGTLISNCWSNKAWVFNNNGGGIAVLDNGTVRLEDCTFRACMANDMGGAIHTESGKTMTIINTDFSGCRANQDEGGAIFMDGGPVEYTGGTVKSCRSDDDQAGAIYQKRGSLYCENVSFRNNNASEDGGAVYIDTDSQTWFVKCEFTGNRCGGDGGAICEYDNYLYMEDCTLTSNVSSGQGGAVYIPNSIDLAGKTIIRDNSGSGSFDNLVLEDGANLYDQGLLYGSKVHLRSTLNGEVSLSSSSYKMSEYQMKNVFVPDYGSLKLNKQETVSTRLSASAFSPGRIVLIIGGILVVLGGVAAGIVISRRRKGEQA